MVKQAFQTCNANMHPYANCLSFCSDQGFVDGKKNAGDFSSQTENMLSAPFLFPTQIIVPNTA